MLLKRERVGEFDNEAVTLTDVADGPPDVDHKLKSIPARQSGVDPNDVEMHHCSVGQSTAFGGRDEYEIHASSRFNFMDQNNGIAGQRAAVPLRNLEQGEDDFDHVLQQDFASYQF